MVSFSFKPQIQAALFNYVDAARELDLVKARLDDLKDCACRASFVELKPAEDMNSLGHVCTFNTQKLKWPMIERLMGCSWSARDGINNRWQLTY